MHVRIRVTCWGEPRTTSWQYCVYVVVGRCGKRTKQFEQLMALKHGAVTPRQSFQIELYAESAINHERGDIEQVPWPANHTFLVQVGSCGCEGKRLAKHRRDCVGLLVKPFILEKLYWSAASFSKLPVTSISPTTMPFRTNSVLRRALSVMLASWHETPLHRDRVA